MAARQRRCHEVEYKTLGDDMQIVELELDYGETVIAEAGVMNYMDDGIDFEAKMGDGSSPEEGFFGSLMSAGKRAITGEGLFLATLRGTGIVLVQSLPFSRLTDRILRNAPSAGGSRKGEGSILGGNGDNR